MKEPEPLQQIDRTFVHLKGRKLSFFGGCDYHRLSSNPQVLRAVQLGLEKYGLSVSASRLTTGNHRVYQELEAQLAAFFGAESALLVPGGYMAAKVAAEGLVGEFTLAFIDARAHPALFEAAEALHCPVTTFPHRSTEGLRIALRKIARRTRPILLTDGMFSHDGSVAPLHAYRKLLPKIAWMLVDDAHGAGVLGQTAKGTLEHEMVSRDRIIQVITLSKALGGYGGAVLSARKLRQKMLRNSRAFIGSTPMPLPIACAASAAIRLLQRRPDVGRKLRKNAACVKQALAEAGLPVELTPGPVIALPVLSRSQTVFLKQALLMNRIYPTLIRYFRSPETGYFRFVISSAHSDEQLDHLASVLRRTWRELRFRPDSGVTASRMRAHHPARRPGCGRRA